MPGWQSGNAAVSNTAPLWLTGSNPVPGVYKMKILSLNSNLAPWTRNRSKRRKLLVEKINSSDSDIVCLQEVFIKRDAERIMNPLREAGYVSFYYIKDLLIATKNVISSRNYETFKEQGQLLSYSILDVFYKKAFQYFSLAKAQNLYFIHTHLLSASGKQTNHYEDTRKKQVLEILNNVRGKKKTLIVGDFNFPPDSEAYRLLMEEDFTDEFKDLGITFPKEKTSIDYIFTRNIESLERRVIETDGLSDHNGLMLEIESFKNI